MDEAALGHCEDVVMWLRAGGEMTYTAADLIEELVAEVRRLQALLAEGQP